MTTRRRFLKIVGSSAIILAAGAGGFALTRRPDAALAPWEMAGGADYEDPRVRALSYAILAPNPHNRQPWQVDLSIDNEATLYCDLDRLLPETDPFDRQILIGLGCFSELLRLAALADGWSVEVAPFPDGTPDTRLDTRAIARFRFTETADAPDPLFAQVRHRRSNKEPFDTSRTVPSDLLHLIAAQAGTGLASSFTNEANDIEELRALSWEAHSIEVLTHRTNMESVDLMRIGKAEINANPDGIDLGGPVLEAAALAGIVTREELADPSSAGFAQGMDMYHAILHSSMAYLWLKTDGNERVDQFKAGAAWLRINLKATELGLAIHPLSQALQEYPEMTDLYDAIHTRLAEPGERIQMFARLGYGPTIAPGPRWPIETRIITR